MTIENNSREKLIALLQLAYSGELAAAHAYRGHWHSVSSVDERESIRKIEDDEWRHRKLVGEMLAGLGAGPSKRREIRAAIIGRTLGFSCSDKDNKLIRRSPAVSDNRARRLALTCNSNLPARCRTTTTS